MRLPALRLLASASIANSSGVGPDSTMPVSIPEENRSPISAVAANAAAGSSKNLP